MSDSAGPGNRGPGFVDVRLVQLPVRVHDRTQEHSEELLREFALIAQAHRSNAGSAEQVPSRLMQLVHRLTASYPNLGEMQEQRLAEALAAGQTEIPELVFTVPAGAAADFQALADMLDEADEYCRAGELLLTLATPADLRRYRRWYLGEFIRQLGGGAPVPWPEYPD